MKLNLIKYLFGFVLLLLAACTSEEFSEVSPSQNEFAYVEGDKIVVNMSVEVPELKDIGTRAFTDAADYNDLHLYLVEFDDNGSPLRNTLKTVYTPENETSEDDRINYKVILNQSDQPRILHLIALPKDKDLSIEYGVEGSIMPNLKTDDQTLAYWRRLVFASGYGQEVDGEVQLSKELDQLRHVALIRNYACISVDDRTGENFELKGFAIVNNPLAGTMAPWKSSDYSFPDFLDADQKPLDFADLAAKYSGIVPAGVSFSNQETGPVVEDDISPKYMYERPFNSIRHTYIIIKGRRTGDEKDSYYKLDLGKNDNNGIFRYYSILRNYNYRIILNRIDAKGYDNVMEAVQGVVYNNFSFDIELTSMLNISDGQEIVYVNFTTVVLTDPESQALDFQYRYRSLSASSPTYNNEDVNFIDLEPGDVIKSVEVDETDDENGWRNVRIICKPAQTETKTQ